MTTIFQYQIYQSISVKSSTLLVVFFLLFNLTIDAQDNYLITDEDRNSLESVIVEKYYVYDSVDFTAPLVNALPAGSVTYRIYIDLKPGYSLQLVYGDNMHELFIKTTTGIFNNKDAFAYTGFNIDALKINENTVAFDSWLTMGAATRLHTGIPKSEDTDGSIILNESLKNTDGLTHSNLPVLKLFNLDMDYFNLNSKNSQVFSVIDGGWASLGGAKGPTESNEVLIAQLTTNGKLSFELNVQIGTPTGGYVKFVAKNPTGTEIQFDGLAYKLMN